MNSIFLSALLLVSILYGCERPKSAAPATIKAGSYNLAILGSTKTARPATMGILSRIAAGFDLLALQEVGSNASKAGDEACARAMDAYLALINTAAGGDLFAYVRGDQYAFVYRKDKLAVESWNLYAGPQAFAYEPLVARFKIQGAALDFIAIAIHTSPGLAKLEVPALALAMEETAASYGEPDVICLGDFNADGAYYDEGDGASLAGFPLPGFISAIPNEADTSVGKDLLAYDRIELTASMAEDFTGNWGVLRPASMFDLSACEGPADFAGTERALSDHYPVWIELATGADRD